MNSICEWDLVLEHEWGTVGPRSLSAARRFAAYCGCAHALLAHSAPAALETVLRAFEIGYGDEVIAASFGNPADAMAVATVGAAPVFVDLDARTYTISAAHARRAVTPRTRAVVADALGGSPCDARALRELCNEYGLKLILNLADGYAVSQAGRPLASWADAAVADVSDGCAVSCGLGGAVLCDGREVFDRCFAVHNCGRPLGEGATLTFDEVLGGDMRIAEWQCLMLERALVRAKKADAAPSPFLPSVPGAQCDPAAGWFCDERELDGDGWRADRPYRAMHRAPVFQSEAYRKLTGETGSWGDEAFPVSVWAQEHLVRVRK